VQVYLSPHADDAALSCGGHIAALVQRGERVVIHTLMIADPSPAALRTPLAKHFHAMWGLGDDVVRVRRAEDAEAARRLGASVQFGALLEAGYRMTPDGQPCYPAPESIHRAPHPDDPLLAWLTPDGAAGLLAPLSLKAGDTLHVPLGVGNHVDHQIVREIGKLVRAGRPEFEVVFYEEYPYAAWNDQEAPNAVAALGLAVERVLHPLTLRHRLLRIAAIAAYRSQLTMIWPRGAVGMAVRTWQFMKRMGGEVEWRPAQAVTP
jgi:LmbE family N-acetylglucosaminyl deacetylase